jgi:hypothetical protein
MSTTRRFTPPRLFIAISGALSLAALAGYTGAGAQAPTIQHFPADFPGPPFYANFSATFMPTDAGTVGIVFYRDPSCIPVDFNLLIQADPPTAFGCPLTIEGRRWLHPPDPAAFQVRVWGLGAVPIYFVDADELSAATIDGTLTIVELQSLPSLIVGVADDYHQVIHNSNQAPGAETQLKGKGHETMDAHGTIVGSGLPFYFHYIEEFDPNTSIRTFRVVRIDIG